MCAAFTTGEMVKVKPSKVVAGQDAEKTNEFLQILSISILKDVSCPFPVDVTNIQ